VKKQLIKWEGSSDGDGWCGDKTHADGGGKVNGVSDNSETDLRGGGSSTSV